MEHVDRLQGMLDFEGCTSPQFATKVGLGRIGLAGFFLGSVFGASCAVLCLSLVVDIPYGGIVTQWALYVAALSGFHFSEFLVTALYKPDAVSYDSFVINHSAAYTVAALTSWAEFWLETLLLKRETKFQPRLLALGLLLVGAGQFMRGAAMWTCKSHFSHVIMEQRAAGHQLVTHGVYKYLRHPSYFGWFWWCVGTQCLLCNPLCILAYAVAAWDFFRKRIPYEEATLLRFYPTQYPSYVGRTYIGIPFVAGFTMPEDTATGEKRE